MLESKIIEVSPQMFKKDYTFTEDSVKGKKAMRAETIYNATVMYNDWIFDADENSMNRMNRHLQLANYKFNYDVSNDKTSSDAYRDNYLMTFVDWKLADNTIQQINIEQLASVFKLAVDNMTEHWLIG